MTTHFCIVLKSRADRQLHAQSQFERENVPVKWVYAAEGIAHGMYPLYAMHYEQGPDKPYYITPGMLSLCVVNWYIAQMAHLMGCEDWIVYEDDCILPENYLAKLEEIREQRKPKTKAVWLDHCCTDDKKRWQQTKDLWRVEYPLCTGAVWYFEDAWKDILEHTERMDTPWDIILEQRVSKFWQPCVVVPKLVKQASFEGKMDSTLAWGGHVPHKGDWD